MFNPRGQVRRHIPTRLLDREPLVLSRLMKLESDQRDTRQSMLAKVAGLSVDDLGDDGVHVRPEQISLWEAWVLFRSNWLANGHFS